MRSQVSRHLGIISGEALLAKRVGVEGELSEERLDPDIHRGVGNHRSREGSDPLVVVVDHIGVALGSIVAGVKDTLTVLSGAHRMLSTRRKNRMSYPWCSNSRQWAEVIHSGLSLGSPIRSDARWSPGGRQSTSSPA